MTHRRSVAWTVAAAFVFCMTTRAATAADWMLLEVPGVWRKQTPALQGYQGHAWYRCYVKAPENWIADDHPRALWAGSVTVGIDGLHGAYELYVNGRKIDHAGQMPPDFEAATPGDRRHNVPLGTLRKGLNVIAIRVHSGSQQGGFHGPPPVISGYYKEILLAGPWEFRRGDDAEWAKGDDAPRSDKVVYDDAVDATTPLHRPAKLIHGPRREPAEALRALQPAEDLAVDQVLADPTIAQPISLNFDERGRLWVVEYLQYPWPEGLVSVSRDKYYRFAYGQKLPPPPYEPDSPFRGRDRISVHEDTNGDGAFDKHTVVIDGLNITTAALPVSDGVWVLSPPQLLFFRFDENGLTDPIPEVHLDGFGIEDTHSTTSSLTWGPDGWLYATQGMTVTARIDRPGVEDFEPIYRQGAMIWRYHRPTGRVEVFAEGGGNTFSLEIDSKGRVLTGHNGGATRGFDFHQDGYYDKGGSGRFGPMSNPYTFGLLAPMKADGPVVRFSSAALVYDATALPERYHGRLFCADPLHGFIVLAERTPAGSTFITSDLDHALRSEDAAFRPVTLSLGPDGAGYVADFYEHYIAHGQNYSGMLDPTSGRVYRLRGRDYRPLRPFDLRQHSTAELLELLEHENRWFRRTALRLLGERRDRTILPRLKELIRGRDGQLALEALWAANLLGGLDEELALQTLSHADPHVRRWTARLAGDDRQTTPRIAQQLAELALTEPDAEVRSQLASTARRLPAGQGMPIVQGLLRRSEDVGDAHIPLLLWWAIEARCEGERGRVLEMLESAATWELPMVEQHIVGRLMRRFTATGVRRDLLTCAKLLELAPSDAHKQKLLSGLEEGLAGRTLAEPPQPLVEALAKAGGGSLILRLRQGEAEAIEQALRMIGDRTADAVERRRAMEFFGQVQVDRSVPLLLEAAASEPDASLRRAALGALQAYDSPQIGRRIVRLYEQFPAEARSAALGLLASRAAWSLELVEAVEAGAIAAEAVPTEIVRQIELHENPSLQRMLHRIWSDAAPRPRDGVQQRIAELKQVIRAAEGNPHRGRQLYVKHCGACHRLFDDGGDIGPNLSTWGREDLDRLLMAVVDPSADIREGYEHYVLITHDGRTLSGLLADQDPLVVVLRDLAGQDITLRREQIEHVQLLDKSPMPENILDALADQQIRDLFAHLQAGQPSPD